MSSSTVSITANSSNPSLRRPLLDPSSVNGKDLSHSIKPGAETVLERSRDDVDQTKNTLPTNSTTKLRKRTAVKKTRARSSSRPPWKTVVRMITKNFVVLLILLLLAQMIRKLALNQVFDQERRIEKVEDFVKNTTKIMQGDFDCELRIAAVEAFVKNTTKQGDFDYERRIVELEAIVINTSKMLQGEFVYKLRIAELEAFVKNTTRIMQGDFEYKRRIAEVEEIVKDSNKMMQGYYDYELRIADVEAFVKTTAKMIHAQVASTEKKFKTVYHEQSKITNTVNNLDGKFKSMNKSSKDTFDKFVKRIENEIYNINRLKLDVEKVVNIMHTGFLCLILVWLLVQYWL